MAGKSVKLGRPSKYSEDLVGEICERIGEGESLRSICRDEKMPDLRNAMRWLVVREDFRLQYERAREIQADSFVDDIVRIADTETDPNVARVRIDARKWVAGKQRPKKYGEKIELEHGSDPNKPVLQRIERVIVDPKKETPT